MSLIRLLTAGKSLVGLKKLEHRYQLPGQRALPEFGSKKNPFRATVFPDKPESTVAEANQAVSEGADNSPISPASQMKVSKPLPAEPPVATCKPAAPSRGSALKALLLWGRVKKAKPFGGAPGRPLVQGELSLDSVKVVRNDLSESDVEIVRVERSSARTDDRKSSLAETQLGMGMGQLLGAGKL